MILQIINIIANLIIGISVTIFYIYIYGDESKVVHKWNFAQHFALKFGLIGIICGAFINTITIVNSAFSEVALNVGFAMVFTWAAIFHRKLFKNERSKNHRKN